MTDLLALRSRYIECSAGAAYRRRTGSGTRPDAGRRIRLIVDRCHRRWPTARGVSRLLEGKLFNVLRAAEG
jgi:hypothetical protein